MSSKRYISAEQAAQDDFGDKFTGKKGEVIYDAKTAYGPWAMMTETSWKTHGNPRKALGLGWGQKYVRNAEGHLIQAEGGA